MSLLNLQRVAGKALHKVSRRCKVAWTCLPPYPSAPLLTVKGLHMQPISGLHVRWHTLKLLLHSVCRCMTYSLPPWSLPLQLLQQHQKAGWCSAGFVPTAPLPSSSLVSCLLLLQTPALSWACKARKGRSKCVLPVVKIDLPDNSKRNLRRSKKEIFNSHLVWKWKQVFI